MNILLLLSLDLEITQRLETLIFRGDFALLDVLLVLGGEVVDRILGREKDCEKNETRNAPIPFQMLGIAFVDS